MPIERDEFIAHIGYVRSDIQQLVDRLDVLNGRTRDVETKIAILGAHEPNASAAAAWGGGIGGVVVGLIEAAKWIWTR